MVRISDSKGKIDGSWSKDARRSRSSRNKQRRVEGDFWSRTRRVALES